jgi:hypothetical protein
LALRSSLISDFRASSLEESEERSLRLDPAVEIYHRRFPSAVTLDAEGFLGEFRSMLSSFSEVITAEFKITDISVQNSSSGSSQAPGLIPIR